MSRAQRHIAQISLLVDDYDQAISYYQSKLGFHLCQDDDLGGGKRWVRVAPSPDSQFCLLLAQPTTSQQRSMVGNQGADRVWLFLHTDDFERDYQRMKQAGVTFCETPRDELYGKVVVFEDLYGNRWDLLQPR